ncbi:MAG: parvulin-like peptidyl-prolyl isomerase [Cellvibrionaceae bacterium]|jgi:parvulin-like peptidyl-prolyl isomerase
MSHAKDDFLHFRNLVFLLMILALGSACSGSEDVDPSGLTATAEIALVAIELPTDIPTPIPDTPTPIPPTLTPTPPLVALVNGDLITLADYQADLDQYTQALAAIGEGLPENYQNSRLMVLVEAVIIRQAAAEWNIEINADELNLALEDVKKRAEENGGYEAWLRANQYDAVQFLEILEQQLLTSAVIDEVVRSVPAATEQVRARYIVVNDVGLAQSIFDQVLAGSNFADLAVTYSLDQATAPDGGDLDFIMRGWLFQPEVEDVIFSLEPNQTSGIITVDHGNGQISYYLVQVLEKDPARILSSAQRDIVTRKVIEEWLGERLAAAEIIQFE